MKDVFFKKYSIHILLTFLTICIFGILSLFYIDFDLIPNFTYPELTVVTLYPNASPQEIKKVVTNQIEESAAALPGVVKINTISRDSVSIVNIRYDWSVNRDIAHIELREKLDLLKSYFPNEVKRPLILQKSSTSDPVFAISITSKVFDQRDLYLLADKDIKAEFEKIDGVANANIVGGKKPEVLIELSGKLLEKYQISISELKDILEFSNQDFPVGYHTTGNYEYSIRIDGTIKDYKELENIIVKNEDNQFVYLKDIANIKYTYEDPDNCALINNTDALILYCFLSPEANILKTTGKINDQLKILEDRYENRIDFLTIYNNGEFVRSSLNELFIAMLTGILFTVFSIIIFLKRLDLSLIIVITIPVSIMGTVIMMRLTNISINLLTIIAFNLSIGMVVDNSVVMIDHLLHDNPDTSINSALIANTFTSVVVFLPVLLVTGLLKLIFIQFSYIIVMQLMMSLAVSLFLTPLLFFSLKKKTLDKLFNKEKDKSKTSLRDKLLNGFTRRIEKILKFKFPVIVFFLLLSIPGIFLLSGIKKKFIESFPENKFECDIFIKDQVPFEYTLRITKIISRYFLGHPSVTYVIAQVGVDSEDFSLNLNGLYGENTARLQVFASEYGNRMESVINDLRSQLSQFSDIDFIFSVQNNPIQKLITSTNFKSKILIYARDQAELKELSNTVSGYIKKHSLANDVLDMYYKNTMEYSVTVKRNESALYKTDAFSIAELLTTAISGSNINVWRKDDYEIPIRLQFNRDEFQYPEELLDLKIYNQEKELLNFKDLIEIEKKKTEAKIFTENQNTMTEILLNPVYEKEDELVNYLENIKKDSMKTITYENEFSLLKENLSTLFIALFLAIFLEYTILASQFRSFFKPFLILLLIVISIPGILAILYITNNSININTFMSFIVLVGLMVNNGIMLFYEYETLEDKTAKSIARATSKRLEPILITVLSTILAILPTLFTSNQIQVSLSLTLIAGLIYSTILTLILLPVFYSIFYRKRDEKDH